MPPFFDFYTLKLSLLPLPGTLILFMLGVCDITICFLEAMVIGVFSYYEMLFMLKFTPPLNELSLCFTVNFVAALEGEPLFD